MSETELVSPPESPNEEMMEKTYDIFYEEMKSLVDKLRPAGMIRAIQVGFFFQKTSTFGTGLNIVTWKRKHVMPFGKRMKNLPRNMETCFLM